MAAAPVATAVGHVAIELQVVPAGGEGGPIGQLSMPREGLSHRVAVHEGEAVLRDGVITPGVEEHAPVSFEAFARAHAA
jgi:hypothetical protein